MNHKAFALSLFLGCSMIWASVPAALAATLFETPSARAAEPLPAQADGAGAELAKGKTFLRRGKAAEALVHLNKALALYQQAKQSGGEAAAHDLLGELYERQGRYDIALEHFKKAHEIFSNKASEVSASRLVASAVVANFDLYHANLMLAKVGNMHYRQGDIPAASAAFGQMKVTKPDTSTLGKAKKVGGLFGSISSIASGGVAPSDALGAASTIKQRFEIYHQTITYATNQIGMGRIAYFNNQLDAARKHFENALAATKGDLPFIGNLGQSRRFRTAARTSLADVALRQSRFADAVKLYQEAANGARDDKRLDLIWPAQRGLGLARWKMAAQEKDAKKADKAREDSLGAYRESLDTIEKLRQGSLRADESRTSFLATTKDVFDEASEAFADMALLAVPAATTPGAPLQGKALDYAAEAFRIVEQGRARSLLDLLAETGANITEGVPAPLLKRKEQNLDQQEEIAGQLTGVTLTGEPPTKPVDELEKELDRLQNEYETIENEIRASSPRYDALTSIKPRTLAEIQQGVLDGETALVEYSLGQDRSYLWVATREGVSLHKIAPRATLETMVLDLREKLVAPSQVAANDYAKSAHALYRELLAPAAPAIGQRRLLVVADGALNYIPFEALTTTADGADYSALAYLINTNDIVYAPSASVIAAIRQQAAASGGNKDGRAMLLVADPVFDAGDPRARGAKPGASASAASITRGLGLSLSSAQLARLPGTRTEAQKIGQLAKAANLKADTWLDLDASEANIEARDLKQYRILHVATHGILNTERPQFTGVVLSLVGNESSDGFLRTDEIFNLRLGSPLVMLSACETGLGKEKRGEGIIGLTRAFMYAGAPTVGVSLWPVADTSTADLMSDFYKRLLAKEGTSPTAAMRGARQQMIAGKKQSAPFFWSPFVLVGDWK